MTSDGSIDTPSGPYRIGPRRRCRRRGRQRHTPGIKQQVAAVTHPDGSNGLRFQGRLTSRIDRTGIDTESAMKTGRQAAPPTNLPAGDHRFHAQGLDPPGGRLAHPERFTRKSFDASGLVLPQLRLSVRGSAIG